MITPDNIRAKLLRQYFEFLHLWLHGESFLPLDLPIGKMPTEWSNFRAQVEQLNKESKTYQRYGYRVETEMRQSKRLGKQEFPTRIWIDSEDDFLHLIRKRDEFGQFKEDITLIRSQVPQLETWLEENLQGIIQHHGEWQALLEVCQFFIEHPQSGLYIRELPLSVDTKFVEQHTSILRSLLDFLLPSYMIDLEEKRFSRRYGLREGETLVRVRLLDHQLERRYGLPLSDLSVPLSDLNALDLTGEMGIVVENLTTFLTLPLFTATFALFGKGFDAIQLAKVNWLRQCPFVYWGDLDAQGFEILAYLRQGFPHTPSVMMDRGTFEAFAEFSVPGTPTVVQELPTLSPEERALYVWLTERNLRLEQERIPYPYALNQLERALQELHQLNKQK